MLTYEDYPFDIKKHNVHDIVEFIIHTQKESIEEGESEADYLTQLIGALTFVRDSYHLKSEDE